MRRGGALYKYPNKLGGETEKMKKNERRRIEKGLVFAILLVILAFVCVESAAATTGGPDFFGYSFIDNDGEADGPTYSWIDITTSGTEILPDTDDGREYGVPIGFTFNFYGTDYSDLNINTNGLTLTSDGGSYLNQPIGNPGAPNNFMAPFWDDLTTRDYAGAGAVYHETIGDAPNRKFVIEWYDLQQWSSSPSGVTFEAILYEGTNDILFQYNDTDFGVPWCDAGASATVGIESASGQGLQYSYNQPVITPNLAILFTYPGGDCCVCPSPDSLAGTPCVCIQTGAENICVNPPNNGVWVGPNGCVPGTTLGCEGNQCDGGGGCEIPEFSTIAIPVASILGLLFFFNYRKRRKE